MKTKNIIVTGSSGFIGSHLLKILCKSTAYRVTTVDKIQGYNELRYLSGLNIANHYLPDEFQKIIENDDPMFKNSVIIHLGACSDTTNWDDDYLLVNNFRYTKLLIEYAKNNQAQLVYASSASVYGDGAQGFTEDPSSESCLNLYAYSKWLADSYYRNTYNESLPGIVGLRFFNVYGTNEFHKGKMASVVHKFLYELKLHGKCKLFEIPNHQKVSEIKRDWVYVNDVVNVIQHFVDNPRLFGIYNVGSGTANTFETVAKTIIDYLYQETCYKKFVEYVKMPENLKNKYQYYTCACLKKLRSTNYKHKFCDLNVGITEVLKDLNSKL